jgi:dihydroorotase
MLDLKIVGGKVFLSGGLIMDTAIGVKEGKIVALGSESTLPSADRVINVQGRLILPGVIDTHVHFRDPGYTYKEDFESGSKAAAAGGVTMIADMPNVNPVPDTAEKFRKHRENASRKSVVDFSHIAAATRIDEIPKIASEGALAFKIYMMIDVGREYPHPSATGVRHRGDLLKIFSAVANTGKVCIVHPWDQDIWEIISREKIDRGDTDFREYAKAVRAYDSIILNLGISTAIELQRVTGVKLHIAHLSSKRGGELVSAAKKHGLPVTTEVNPNDLFLSNNWDNIERLGPYALRWWVPEEDAEYTWRAVMSGEVDVIASDHAPHTKEEKEVGWRNMWNAPGGVPGIEWYLGLLLNEVNSGKLTLERLVRLCSENPARIFNLYPRKGCITIGADADFVVVDLNKEVRLGELKIYTKCNYNPYSECKVKGYPVMTIVRGEVVMEDNEVIGKPGYGKFIAPSSSPV